MCLSWGGKEIAGICAQDKFSFPMLLSLNLSLKRTCKYALTIGDRPTDFPLPIMVITMVTTVGWASADLTWREVLVIVLKTKDAVFLVIIGLSFIASHRVVLQVFIIRKF